MNSENLLKKKKVRQFKAEYSAYLCYPHRIKELNERKYRLDCMFDVRSPNMSGIRYAPSSRDERLANYAYQRGRIDDELALMNRNSKRIEHILGLMNPRLRQAFEEVFSGKSTFIEMEGKLAMSESSIRRAINKEIAKALDVYDNGG